MSTRSMRQPFAFISLLILLVSVLLACGLPVMAQQPQTVPGQAPRSSPIMFIENVGQFANGARFQVRGGSDTMWLAEDAMWITVTEER